jgi:ATP-dependent exoDNAse (exonuclease V) alpha subunit
VNGDLGEFLSKDGDYAIVRLKRTGQEVKVLNVTRTVTIPLEVGRRKQLKAQGKIELIEGRKEIVGSVTYMPLRLAWATTVHKSQGLSLDKVQVNINDRFFGTPGMIYVSLSRARTAEGLRLVGSPAAFASRCTVDERIKPWL